MMRRYDHIMMGLKIHSITKTSFRLEDCHELRPVGPRKFRIYPISGSESSKRKVIRAPY